MYRTWLGTVISRVVDVRVSEKMRVIFFSYDMVCHETFVKFRNISSSFSHNAFLYLHLQVGNFSAAKH